MHDITFKCFVISVPTRPEQQHRQQVLLGTSYRVRERVKGWWGKVANTRSSLEQCTNTFGHGIQIGLGRQLHTSLTLKCLCAVRTSFDLEMIRPGTRRHMHNVGNRFATGCTALIRICVYCQLHLHLLVQLDYDSLHQSWAKFSTNFWVIYTKFDCITLFNFKV